VSQSTELSLLLTVAESECRRQSKSGSRNMSGRERERET